MRSGLPANHGLSDVVLNSAELMPKENGQPSLTDIQYEALEAGVANSQSVLVSAPTSTGKTLVGWWAISTAIQNGCNAVYLVSYRALAAQKFEEAQRLFLEAVLDGDQSAIVCATGDGVVDASGRSVSTPLSARILVATYEKFLGCLSVGGAPRDLSNTCFICDEVQIVGDKKRGQNAELLLTLMKRAGWRQFVGLSAVLGQNDANSLSNWLNLRLVRNPSREKSLKIECRTPDAVHQVTYAPGRDGDIQRRAEARERNVIRVVSELVNRREYGPVIVFCMKVDDTYDLSNQWTAGRPITNNAIGDLPEVNADLLRSIRRGAAFHNAELSDDERRFVEEQIGEGNIDVVFATSTLAAGVNFPLGSAVFASWRRWNFDRGAHEPISRAEFQNMAGRVGRMGQADREGYVILTAGDQHAPLNRALELIDFSVQDGLGHGITPEDFSILTLQLFAGRLCANRADAFALISSTLSAVREIEFNAAGIAHWQLALNAQIDRLILADCLVEARGSISVTSFGSAVAYSGLKAETAIYFIEGLIASGDALIGMLPTAEAPGHEDDILFVMAHAALSSPEYSVRGGKQTREINWKVSRNLVGNDYARRLERVLFFQPWIADVGAANGARLITEWSAGLARNNEQISVPDVRMGVVQTLAGDIGWILTGISEVISRITAPSIADESRPRMLRGGGHEVDRVRRWARILRRQATRISTGLPPDVVWMTALELQGRRKRLSRLQILSLRDHGFTRPIDVMNGDDAVDRRRRQALNAVQNPAVANQTRDAARRWKLTDREYWKRQHLRRARRLDGEELVESLYAHRGDALETAFATAMEFIGANAEQLDRRGRQAHPDYLLTIADFVPIVVEVKSRNSDTDLVSLNSALEVLAASELIGYRENFCVTLCSPGVEPNVPGIIESCRRLCVVDVSDFCEAVLRVKEGSASMQDFYNWITTPGIALMADLPHAG
jgi:helicase